MADDKPKSAEGLLERLYPDELPEDGPALKELGPDELAELAEYRRILARIRREEPAEKVPLEVHHSIMAAARQHAEAQDNRVSAAAQRALRPAAEPRAAGESADQPTFWARFGLRSLGQFALVAMVLLSAGVLFTQFRVDPLRDAKYSSANERVVSHVKFDNAPRASSPSRAAQPAEEAEVEGSTRQEAELAALDEPAEEERSAQRAGEKRERSSDASRAAKKEELALSTPRPKPRAARARPMAKQAAPRVQHSISLFDSEPEPEALPLDELEQSFRDGDYHEVISGADTLLERADITPAERAQALSLKARAEAANEQDEAALKTYEALKAEHPEYERSMVDAEIARLRERRRHEPRREGPARERRARPAAIPSKASGF